MASDVTEVFPKVVIAGRTFSWKITFRKHGQTWVKFCQFSSLQYPIKQHHPMERFFPHIGICWQIWVIDERATNQRARNLKVGFDVDQLGITAAETVGFSLQKVYSSNKSFFANRDHACSGGLPNYLHQHNLCDPIPRCHLKIAINYYLCDEVRANLLKDLELVLRCRFWGARVFAVESLVCKSFVITKSHKYQRRQIPTTLGICCQAINCDIIIKMI